MPVSARGGQRAKRVRQGEGLSGQEKGLGLKGRMSPEVADHAPGYEGLGVSEVSLLEIRCCSVWGRKGEGTRRCQRLTCPSLSHPSMAG